MKGWVSFNEELKVVELLLFARQLQVSFNEELKGHVFSPLAAGGSVYPLMRNWKSPITVQLLVVAAVSFNEELKGFAYTRGSSKKKVSFNEELKDNKIAVKCHLRHVSFNEELKGLLISTHPCKRCGIL